MGKKSTTIIIVVLLVVISIMMGLIYLLSGGPKISVLNNSKYFEVTYNPSQKFADDLLHFGIWQKNKIRINDSAATYTVKKIIVVITDSPQNMYIVVDPRDNSKIIGSTSIQVNNNIFYDYVYLNPIILSDSYFKSYKKDLNSFVFWLVMSDFYSSTHISSTAQIRTDNVAKIVQLYGSKNKPFIVKIK